MRLAALCCVALLAGCAGGAPRDDAEIADNFCATRIERSVLPVPQPTPGQASRLMAAGISAESVDTAEAIGALDVLDSLIASERRPDDALRVVLARQMVTQRVLLGLLDVQTSLATLDCEEERGDRLRGQLQRVEDRRTRNINLVSLLLGATTAVATGGLSLAGSSNAGDIVGILGGTAGAGTSALLLFPSSSGTLRSGTNILDEIRRQPERSQQFPPSVWRYLTQRDALGMPNVADEIMEEWRRTGLLTEGDPASEAVFAFEARLGVGDVERRDAMLHLLQARVTLMTRDLRLLLEEVVARPVPGLQPRGVRAP